MLIFEEQIETLEELYGDKIRSILALSQYLDEVLEHRDRLDLYTLSCLTTTIAKLQTEYDTYATLFLREVERRGEDDDIMVSFKECQDTDDLLFIAAESNDKFGCIAANRQGEYLIFDARDIKTLYIEEV